ncbi:hypothetical protein SMICM304S_09893 [Streptomyces microflavus]
MGHAVLPQHPPARYAGGARAQPARAVARGGREGADPGAPGRSGRRGPLVHAPGSGGDAGEPDGDRPAHRDPHHGPGPRPARPRREVPQRHDHGDLSDHCDHTATALFSWTAISQYRGPAEGRHFAVEAFRGYYNERWPHNLSPQAVSLKEFFLNIYGAADGYDCGDPAGSGDYAVGLDTGPRLGPEHHPALPRHGRPVAEGRAGTADGLRRDRPAGGGLGAGAARRRPVARPLPAGRRSARARTRRVADPGRPLAGVRRTALPPRPRRRARTGDRRARTVRPRRAVRRMGDPGQPLGGGPPPRPPPGRAGRDPGRQGPPAPVLAQRRPRRPLAGPGGGRQLGRVAGPARVRRPGRAVRAHRPRRIRRAVRLQPRRGLPLEPGHHRLAPLARPPVQAERSLRSTGRPRAAGRPGAGRFPEAWRRPSDAR